MQKVFGHVDGVEASKIDERRSCALSATRMYVMDKFNLASDPCDRRIIRFNTFMQKSLSSELKLPA